MTSSTTTMPHPPSPGAHQAPERARGVAEPGSGGLEPAPGAPPIRRTIDDWWLMAVLIPSFGLAISHATGLFGGLDTSHAAWWWGHLWFVGGAGLIYGANRTLLFAGRVHADWFSRPVARLALLATGVLFGTVPTTWLMLHAWSALSGVPLGDEVVLVFVVNITCVVFVTWLYETLFLIRERVDDQVRVARLAAARTEAELAALRAQVDPHFLFNALNTLAALVETRPPEARAFIDHLARVYRALLDTRDRALVPLPEELELVHAYAELVRIRFGDAVRTRVQVADAGRWLVPPGAGQVLLENAVRHNAIDPDAPLDIEVTRKGDTLVVSHDRRPRPPVPGAGTGLANLSARAEGTTGRPVDVAIGPVVRVAVPLVAR